MESGSHEACQHVSQDIPLGSLGQVNQANNLGMLFVLSASVGVGSGTALTAAAYVMKLVTLHDQSCAREGCRRLGPLDVHSSECGRYMGLPCVLAEAENSHNVAEDDSSVMHTRRTDNVLKT